MDYVMQCYYFVYESNMPVRFKLQLYNLSTFDTLLFTFLLIISEVHSNLFQLILLVNFRAIFLYVSYLPHRNRFECILSVCKIFNDISNEYKKHIHHYNDESKIADRLIKRHRRIYFLYPSITTL